MRTAYSVRLLALLMQEVFDGSDLLDVQASGFVAH